MYILDLTCQLSTIGDFKSDDMRIIFAEGTLCSSTAIFHAFFSSACMAPTKKGEPSGLPIKEYT
jgi:hypothetical protein